MARARRILIILGAVALGLILASILLIHTPWARNRALAWAAGFVTRFQLVLEAGDLSYNALTRRITLTDVRLAATGHEQRPFLLASRIEVELPWLVYRGRFAIDHLEITKGVVDIYRDANNVVNLPPGSTRPTPEQPRRLNIRGFTLAGLDVRYEDVPRNWGIAVPGIEAALVPTPLGAKGDFGVHGQLAVRLRDRVMTMEPFDTVMTFDGSNVVLESARLSSPEIEAFIAGPIARVLDAPSLDLTIKGSVNLDQAMRWVPPPPVPISGTATIEGTITGPVRDFQTVLNVSSHTLAVGRERELRLSGPVRVNFSSFSGEGMLIKPASNGQIRAGFTVPWGRDRASSATAEWSGLDAHAALRLANVDDQPIGAAFDGSATLTFGEPRRITLTNRSTGRPGRGVVPMTGTITATFVGDDYQYDHDHAFPGFTFEGRMSGRFNRTQATLTTMQGPAHAHISDVGQAVASIETLGFPVAAIMRDVHGPLEAPMTLGGSYRYPQIQTAISSQALELPLLGTVSASAEVAADTSRATIAKINLAQGPATITGDVAADITNRTWSGSLAVSAPNAEALQARVPEAWRVSGPIVATATLGGTFDAFRLDAVIAGQSLTWAGQSIDRVRANAVVTADAIDVSSLELFQGAGYLEGRLRYAWETGGYDAKFKGDRLSWRGTLLSPNDTQAIFAVQFEGAGTTTAPKGLASIDFALSGGDAGTLIGAGQATAELTGDQARIAARLPSIGAIINAEIATSSPYDYRAVAQLDRFELQKLAPFIGAIETEIIGFATGTVTGSGRLADDRDRVAFVNITELDAGIGGVPVSLNAPLNLTMRGDELALKDVFLRVGSGRVSASGEWNTKLDGVFQTQFAGDFRDALRLGMAFGVPRTLDGTGPLMFEITSNGTRLGTSGTLALKNGTFTWGGGPHAVQALIIDAALKGEELTVSRITGDVATGGIIGSFSASGAAKLPELSLAAIDGELALDAARFTFSGIPVAQQRPSRFVFGKGTLTMADVEWLVAENPVVMSGSVGIAEADPPLDLSAKGLVDLRVLSALVSTVAFDGNANVNTLVTGTVSKPLLDGRIDLDDAELAIADPRLVLSDLTGAIVLDGQLAVVDGVRGTANGGALALDGTLQFDGVTLIGGGLNIQAQSVAMELPRGLRSELDALVTYRPDAKAPSLTGDIRVVQSAYTETITLAALARQAATPVVPGSAERGYLDRLRLNLNITTTEDLLVDNNYGRLAAAANVRLIGTVAEPGMEGRVTLQEGGQIFLAGRTFRITRGDISFTDRRHIHPQFNIAAESRVLNEEVTMTLTGTLERPTIDLTSEDGASTPGELAAAIVGTNNTEAALTLLSADLLGVTGRAIGLDAFRVERGAYQDADFRDYQADPALIGTNRTDPTTRLTLGKRLSDQVELTVSQNLRESGGATFVISYYPRHNVELRGISRDSGELGVGIRHQVTFGRGRSRPPSERRVRPVVSDIRFVDVDPAIETLARAEIKLSTGDEFDFLELQEDVDRIRETFHAQGYFEARVRPRRVESDDKRTVIVEYRIERGPATTLQVNGFVAPQDLLDELTEAWHRNVFDQFLIDDLTHRVRRHLVTTGEIGSVVVGRIDRPGPDVKRVRIDVTPGAPVTGREIRFTGNQHLEAARLMTEIEEAGLEVEAWLDRTVAERTLRQAYTEEGFLRVQVAGRPLDIDGTVGVLTFDVTEGPQAIITDVKWSGVADARLPELEKTAALAPPAPYVAATVNEALGRVDTQYRHLGFNEADIEVQPTVNADDTVTLTFVVEEGVKQVLKDVEMTGVEVTSGKVLTQALRFEFGKPVDLDEWAVARKRLYDTNVFRLVDIQPVPLGDPVNGVQPVKAVVSVEEYPEWSFRYGFQLEGERHLEIDEFTSTRNLGVVGELKNPNLFGRALSLGVFGMYQYDRRDATLFFGTSRLFGWRARSTLYTYVSRDRIRDELGEEIVAISDIQGISADQRWRFGGFGFVYGYRFERNRTYDPEPGSDPFPLDFITNLASLSVATVLDRRDDPINPKGGTFSSVSYEHAALRLGSDVSNRKFLVQQYVFVPLGQLVLASRLQAGLAWGRDVLLPSDRFQAGGANTVRGYGEDSLGPRDEFSGVPEGGDKMLVLNQEARFPVYRWAHAVAFVDAGNIWARDQAVKWGELKLGYGFGVRLDTPVGLLRGDVGFPQSPIVTTRSSSGRQARFYFGFGHIF
ncbi:MAG TPA: translocation/assembly module TamB domain-containing protein [Vicinamibacterales bacterium]|nr:translocation/assembly module TamB domain-containing protein [Vicinamibacterales bacterium]